MPAATVFDNRINQWQKEMDLPWGRLKYKLVQANLAKHLEAGPLRVLDAGGGNGLDSVPLAEQGHHVDIVDYSGEMLENALVRANEVGAKDRVAIHQSDVLEIGRLFPDPGFDLVLCHNVIQYVEDVPDLLRKLAATLKVGGLMSIVSVNRFSIPYHAAFLDDNLAEAFERLDARRVKARIFDATMTNYSAAEMSDMLNDAGLTVEQDYGVRCLADYWGNNERKSTPAVFEQIERLEFALTDKYPYKLLARYYQVIARK